MKHLMLKLLIGLFVIVFGFSKDYLPRFSEMIEEKICKLSINTWLNKLKIPEETISNEELKTFDHWKNSKCNQSNKSV